MSSCKTLHDMLAPIAGPRSRPIFPDGELKVALDLVGDDRRGVAEKRCDLSSLTMMGDEAELDHHGHLPARRLRDGHPFGRLHSVGP